MIKSISLLIVTISFLIISCNNHSSASSESHTGRQHNSKKMPLQENPSISKEVKAITPLFLHKDEAVTAYMKNIMHEYLEVKNALLEGSSTTAASAAAKIETRLESFDKSFLTAEQKKLYDPLAENIQKRASELATGNLDQQRSHFAILSQDMFSLTKAFGAGMTIYQQHCPMYNNGAIWLSEVKEIKNPYYGSKMITCGNTETMFQ